MFGLLDQFNTDDPTKQARLAQSLALLQAGGPSRVPVSLFQGLGMAGQAGLEAKRQAQKDAQAKLLQDMQLQQFTSQQDELKRKREQDALRQQTIDGMNPMNAGPVPKQQMDAFTLLKAGMIPATEYMNLTKPKEPKYTTVDGRLIRTDTETPQIALDVPQRPDYNKPFMPDGRPNPAYQAYAKDTAKAGAPSIGINMGQKGYENESKLRNDFRSEPIYKDFNDMQSSYKQIKASLQQETPIGDTAAATKIMKLLDPGSVVRESELGIAMAAAGKMDRLKNFVDMWATGKKLTPTQRVEFGVLADELVRAAGQSYNNKRREYETLGKRYQLDTGVLGTDFEMPKTDEASPLPSMSDIDREIARRRGRNG